MFSFITEMYKSVCVMKLKSISSYLHKLKIIQFLF